MSSEWDLTDNDIRTALKMARLTNRKLSDTIDYLSIELVDSQRELEKVKEELQQMKVKLSAYERALNTLNDLTPEQDKVFSNALDELRNRAKQAEEAVNAAKALVAKIEQVVNDERYHHVWVMSQIHSGPYRGPNFEFEFDALKKALSAMNPDMAEPAPQRMQSNIGFDANGCVVEE